MNMNVLNAGAREITEIVSDEVLIRGTQDVLDLLGDVWGTEYLIFHEHNFEKDFFDLSTRKLGDVLQKFTNYQIKLAIVGDFEKYPSKTLQDFIYESNKQGDYLFLSSIDQVTERWKK